MAHGTPGLKGVTVPSGGHFESWYSEVPGAQWSSEKIEEVLDKVVGDYNRIGNPGKFIVRREEKNRYAIIGTTIRDDAGHEKVVEAIQAGVSNYVMKPINVDILRKKIESTFQRLGKTI